MNRNILHRGLLIITILFLYLGTVSNTALSKSIFCSDTPTSSIQDTSLHIIISKDVLPLFTYTDLSYPNADVSAINSEIQSLDTNTTLQTVRTYSISTGEQRNIYLDITVKPDTVLLYTLADTTGWVINNKKTSRKQFKLADTNDLRIKYYTQHTTSVPIYAYRDVSIGNKEITGIKTSFKITNENAPGKDYIKIYVLPIPNPDTIIVKDLDDSVSEEQYKKFTIKNGEYWQFSKVKNKEIETEITDKEAIEQYNQIKGIRFLIMDVSGYEKFGSYEITLKNLQIKAKLKGRFEQDIIDTICNGETYTLFGKEYGESGEYTYTNIDANSSVDTVIRLHLNINPTYKIDDAEITICQDSTYIFGDTVLSTAGTYTRTLQTVNGCDSVVTLKLNINPTYKIDDAEITICQDSIYSFGDTVLSTAGTYTRTLQTLNGCDSVVTLKLNVSPTYSDSIELAICEGDTFVFGTQTLTTKGTYKETFKTISGCDSIVTLKLNINPTYKIDTAITICEGATYMFGDTILKTSGIYTKTFQTIDGCDSIRVVELIVNPIYKDTIVETICEGEAYIFGTQALTAKGVYTTTFQTTEGCDSVVTLVLNVNPTYTKTDTVVICEGETYTFGTQTITKPTEYKETFKTENNCDSLVILTLIVNPKLDTSITKVICKGETYIFGTQALTTAGIYTKTFQSKVTGCDSTVTLNLIVNPKLDTSITASICKDETYIFGTQTLKTTGIYTETFQSKITGCDSVVTLVLTVNPKINTIIEKTICEGEIYAFGTQELKTTGTYTEVFQSEITGCDSIVTLTLNVNRVVDTTIDLRYCRVENNIYSYEYTDQLGDIHAENFVIYKADTTIDKEYKSSNELACKEYVTYNITIIEDRADTIETIICKGDRYQENGFDISTAGYYTHYGKTVDGCDSLLTVHLIVEENYDTTIYAEICEGEVYEFIGSEYDKAGRYTKILRSENGCDSVVTLLLTVYPSYYDTIYETLQTNEVYNKDGIYAFESGKYTKRMTTEKGCDSILILDLTIESPIVVYVPNVIQVGQGGISSGSTGDGDNSKLRYFVEDERFEFVDFRVYNRDGIVVWQARDSQDYWDGKFKGDYCPQGVYVYVLRYRNKSNNEPKYTQGTLMLYR